MVHTYVDILVTASAFLEIAIDSSRAQSLTVKTGIEISAQTEMERERSKSDNRLWQPERPRRWRKKTDGGQISKLTAVADRWNIFRRFFECHSGFRPKLEKFLGGCARLINQKIGKASGRNASPVSYSITSPIPQFIHIKTWGIACWLPVPYSLVFHHVPRRLRFLDGTPGHLWISKSVAYARYHRGRLRYRWLVYRLLSHTSRPPRNHN